LLYRALSNHGQTGWIEGASRTKEVRRALNRTPILAWRRALGCGAVGGERRRDASECHLGSTINKRPHPGRTVYRLCGHVRVMSRRPRSAGITRTGCCRRLRIAEINGDVERASISIPWCYCVERWQAGSLGRYIMCRSRAVASAPATRGERRTGVGVLSAAVLSE
jgi:hypothetical protein